MNTKRSVLFVDDELYVLDGLRRMLRGLRDQWDMQFVDSGAKALEWMAHHPVDVLVSDMRMPGMSGAELLTLAHARHPRTVRIVLSGYADDELIMQCVNSTHQFLSKPCEPELLRATIERTCLVEERSRDDRILAVVSKLQHLPSMPVIYDQLLARIRDPDASIASIAELVARDPGMSAKILKLTNSAFFGLRRHVSDLADAVGFLGLDTLRSLTLSVHVFGQLETSEAVDYRALWHHSLLTAAAARAIAEAAGASPETQTEAFTGGLLHDTGRLILAMNFPEASRAAERQGEPLRQLPERERRLLGFDHARVGAALFGLWGLPDVIVDLVAHHHEPRNSQFADAGALAFVHLADSWLEDQGSIDPLHPTSLDSEYIARTEIYGLARLHRVCSALSAANTQTS
ncbi:response regulator [Opitutales bacterium ASA1]|uniref:HDOD domain-containing protein n=1 Tax=Congregicoccus parvus TaxID=3081749 RepID=UPI002B312E0F|nr:response regulator [Opitutales bacterium ASA1]